MPFHRKKKKNHTMDSLTTIDADEYFSASALQEIARGKNAQIFSIRNNVDPSQLTDKSGATLLHYAAACGNNWLVRYLINWRAKVDATNNLKETPLMFAVKYNHVNTVILFLKANADIFVPDLYGKCALGKAFDNEMIFSKDWFWNFENWKGCYTIETAFQNRITCDSLKNSRHVESKVFHVDFPLYYFVKMKNAEVTRILLEKGSPINAKDLSTGQTSLHIAVAKSDLENIKVLLEFGADVNMKDFGSRTPLACFSVPNDQNRALKIFKLLMQAGATLIDVVNQNIFVDCVLLHGDKEIIGQLLKYPINLHFMDKNGYTPLHYLAQNKNPDVLAELYNFDFDINIRSKDLNNTMLHFAAKKVNYSSIRFLLERNADVNAKCRCGFTPLVSMINRQLYNFSELDNCLGIYIECIEMLLAKGADPRIVTKKSNRYLTEIFAVCQPFSDSLIALMDPILTRLSVIEVSNKQIGPYMRKFIRSFTQFKNIFNKKKIECQEMKQVKLGLSVTLLDFFSATDQKISFYARERRLYSTANIVIENYNLDRCYELKLQENFAKFNALLKLREKAAMILNEIVKEVYNTSIYNVAQKIVEYLEDQELNVFL